MMECILCRVKIKPCGHHDPKWKPEEAMWDGAIVDTFLANYGSKHDGDQFRLALCDKCVSKKLRDGVIVWLGNHLTGDMPEQAGSEKE